MNTAISTEKASEIIEAVIAKGDLAQLTAQERAKYYVRVCESIGLNPMTRPFEYLTLNGKLILYPRKDCTDQLRKIYDVSIVDLAERERDGVLTIVATAAFIDKDGRERRDMSTGAVHIKGLQGEALANAFMKAETKAKRRATLSICGLGFLDETELPAVSPNVPPSPPQNRPRLADRMEALGSSGSPETENPPEKPGRGRTKKTDEPTDAEVELSQQRLGAVLEQLGEPADDRPIDDEPAADPAPDDGWPGPAVDHDYELGKRDAVSGRKACLNREIFEDSGRYASWRKGFDSIKRPRK